MSQPIPPGEPRSYLHHACGQVTVMPEKVIQQYLDNPHSYSETTYCAACKAQVDERDCTWQETGENLHTYFETLKQEYDQARVQSGSAVNLRPGGFRKLLAIAIFVLTVIIPVQALWKEGGLDAETTTGRLPSLTRSTGVKIAWYFWPLAVLGSIFSLAIYCPKWGYKRFALLCGPVAGMGALMFLRYWLTGRTQIYRFEPLLVAMIGALPGIAVWALLIMRKADRRLLR